MQNPFKDVPAGVSKFVVNSVNNKAGAEMVINTNGHNTINIDLQIVFRKVKGFLEGEEAELTNQLVFPIYLLDSNNISPNIGESPLQTLKYEMPLTDWNHNMQQLDMNLAYSFDYHSDFSSGTLNFMIFRQVRNSQGINSTLLQTLYVPMRGESLG